MIRPDAPASAARLWHPWLRIQRLIRVILETRWGSDEWPIVKVELRVELRNALKERSRLERAGWRIRRRELRSPVRPVVMRGIDR